MSSIQRLTLISDPTDEFPKNANNSFKVRLPERLSLPDDVPYCTGSRTEQWRHRDGSSYHCHSIDHDVLDSKVHHRVVSTFQDQGVPFEIGRDYECQITCHVGQPVLETSDARSAQQKHAATHVRTKNAWTRERDERPHVTVKKNWMPTITWKEDALILHAVPERELLNFSHTKALTTFVINLAVAEKFGLIKPPHGRQGSVVGPQGVNGYILGPNLQFTLFSLTYDNETPPTDPSNRKNMNWNGEHCSGIQPTDVIREVTDQVFQVKNNQLHLSRMVEWQFNNLNAYFEKLLGTSKRTVTVGSGKFPLLREMQLLRTGDGESTVEPLHHQWIKVRGNQLEIIEVEIATLHGPLAILAPGKANVTIGLKQL